MVLSLTYNATTKLPVEVEGLTPDWARDKPPAEIERFEIFHGNEKLPLAALFRVQGSAEDGRIDFHGDLQGVHWVGAHMRSGEIRVHGSVGRHLGSGMAGGTLHAYGSAGDWAGAEMEGGVLHIQGNAGDRAGSAYHGSRSGMKGGTLLVEGEAGDEVALAMRRGVVAIGGSAGTLAGYSLLAGTVLIFGNCGSRPGAGMKRGTLGLLGPQIPPLLPTFRHACRQSPQFMTLLLQNLHRHQFPLDESLLAETSFDFYSGDHVTLGKGEIVVRAAKN